MPAPFQREWGPTSVNRLYKLDLISYYVELPGTPLCYKTLGLTAAAENSDSDTEGSDAQDKQDDEVNMPEDDILTMHGGRLQNILDMQVHAAAHRFE